MMSQGSFSVSQIHKLEVANGCSYAGRSHSAMRQAIELIKKAIDWVALGLV
jgi:hypothetical protein